MQGGIDWCKARPEETFTSVWKEISDDKDGPHFMPERIKKVGPSTPSARVPKRCSVEHEFISSWLHPIPQYESKKRVGDWHQKRACAMCYVRAQRDGCARMEGPRGGQSRLSSSPEAR